MDDILSVLYSGQYDPTYQCSPRYYELMEQLDPMCELIHQTFGLKFVDRFTLLFAELAYEQGLEGYRQGVLFGTKLMWEVLDG